MRSVLLLLLRIICLFSISLFAQRSGQIQLGKTIEGELIPNASDVYTLQLDSGKFIYGEVLQMGLDIRAIVYGPDGIQRFRNLGEERGIDPIQFVTDQRGWYRFIIQAAEEKRGYYAFTVKRVEPVAKTPEQKVDQLMHPFNNNTNPGAAIAVISDGKIIFSKGYGMASIEYGVPITPKTPFQIASLSKQFTAFAIAMLASRGKLSLDDDIHKYIPDLPDYGKTITIRNLVHHTSGLREQWSLWEMSGRRMDDVILQEEILSLIKQQQELNFEPGTQMSYNNSGYTVLAEVVERVTGQKFKEWMQQNILLPLQMHSSRIADEYRENIPGLATSYNYGEKGVQKSILNSSNYGPTGVVSTVEDFVKWMENFHTGKLGGQQVINQIQERGVLSGGDTTYYAFGLGVDNSNGFVRMNHSGSMSGYTSRMTFYSQLNKGIVLFSNNRNVLAGYFGNQILGFFFPELVKTIQSQTTVLKAASISLPPEYLERLVGRYTIKSGPALNYYSFDIKREGDQISLQFKGLPFYPLIPINDTLFKVDATGMNIQLSFQKEKVGRITLGNIVMNGNSPFQRFEARDQSQEELNLYQGRYYSSELAIVYNIRVKNKQLIVSNQRTADIVLSQKEVDSFEGVTGGSWWLFSNVKFTKDIQGNIISMQVSSDGIKVIKFNRL